MRIALLAAGGLAGALVLGLVVLAGGGGAQASSASSLVSVATLASRTCPLSGPVEGLSPTQAANADLIVAAAMAASQENTQAARIAVMVAMTESGLANLDHGDRDSLGLFQQRPSQGWGTPAQLMEPTYATDAFITALVKVPRWQHMAPWLAAQAVQRSAYPEGSNYRANWAGAGSITAEAAGNAERPGACGQGSGAVAGPPGSHGLPASYAIPPGTPPGHAAVVAYALAQLGRPYVWGAAGPVSFDCSGLTMAAWARVGVRLDHYSGDQQHEGTAVSASALMPGDLVLTPGSDSPGPGIAGHVGIYLGDGLVVSAIYPAQGVAVQSWSAFTSGGLIALRDPAPGR